MEDTFKDLSTLPGTLQEQAWLEERLETLSVREGCVLAAATMRQPPSTMTEAIDHLQSLDNYEIRFPAGSYEALGEIYLRQETRMPEDAFPYVDLQQVGQKYETEHPGLFIGNCYVEFPKGTPALFYRRQDHVIPDDDGWSVKLKVSSAAVPEGVWLRLPGYDGKMPEESDEVVLALDALKVKSLADCNLLEAHCILTEAGELMEQYNSVAELVRDGAALGYILDEHGQGEPYWEEKFAAAMEYENCRTLKFALDISQNLHCYEWIPDSKIEDVAVKRLLSCGVSEDLVRSGCIDLKRYAEDLLATSGYMQASDESGFLIRNEKQFDYEYAEQGEDAVQSAQGGGLRSSQGSIQLSGQMFV